MSILIRGMTMPTSCSRCPCSDDEVRFCRAKRKYIAMFGKPDWCPLVELPEKHGRLIDADLLKNEYPHDTDWDYPVNTNHYVCESIDSAPTVIEADGE